MPSDRRTFLRHAAALGLLGPAAATLACGDGEGKRDGGQRERPTPRVVTRPVLLAGAADTVHISAPTAELPVAYLSRGEMRVYVDRGHRDWAEHRLGAYVSVTSGLWRIPRPEDDPRAPIIPGDELREFEVVDMGSWDPEMTPTEGDVRLRLGAPISVRIEMVCVPLLSRDAWVSAPPVTVARRDGPAGEGGREDFVDVGAAVLHLDRGCGRGGDAVRLLTWACPDVAEPS